MCACVNVTCSYSNLDASSCGKGGGKKTVRMEIDDHPWHHLPSPTTQSFGGKDDMVGVLVHTLYIKAIVYQSFATRLLLLN